MFSTASVDKFVETFGVTPKNLGFTSLFKAGQSLIACSMAVENDSMLKFFCHIHSGMLLGMLADEVGGKGLDNNKLGISKTIKVTPL